MQSVNSLEDSNDPTEDGAQKEVPDKLDREKQPRKCDIFCPAGDRNRLFEELDRKTAAPLIPGFRGCMLGALIDRGELRPLKVYSIKEQLDAWVLDLLPEDKNVVGILERGLENGSISIPGSGPASRMASRLWEMSPTTSILSALRWRTASAISSSPLFDPASEPLSEEALAVNNYIPSKAAYPLKPSGTTK